MVDLPTIANGAPQVHAPQSRVSAGQVASPYLELASTLNDAARETGDTAKILAHQEGIKAVTLDAAGNVQVQRQPIVGDAAIHFQNGVQMGATAAGETTARNDFIDLRKKFENDPESFRTAAVTYRKEMVGQYGKAAGPDVALAVGKTIDALTTENYKGLLNQKETRELNRATDAINVQIETTKNELYAIAAGGDQSSPEFTSRLQKIGALWGQLRDNPRLSLSQERIDFEIGHLKSQLFVSGMDNRIAKVQAENGVEAAMVEADKVRTDPGLNLTPGQRYAAFNQLVGGINQRVNGQNTADKLVYDQIKSFEKLGADGHTPTPAATAAVRQSALASKNPMLIAALQEVEANQATVAAWQKMSPAQLDASLGDLSRVMREQGSSAGLEQLQKTGVALLKNMREGLKNDPIGWADKTGAVGAAPIDFASPDAVPQMQTRTATAETIAGRYGIPASYLRPDERAVLESISAKGGTAMLAVANTLVNGFGDRAPQVMSEISKESPVLAHLGGLMTSGGSQSLLRDAAAAVQLRQDPDFAKKAPKWLTREPDKMQLVQHTETFAAYGGAFVLAPETGRAAEMTAQAAFFTRAYRNNYDPMFTEGDTGAAKKAYERSLQEAAGATFSGGTQYGGIATVRPGAWWYGTAKVLIPGSIRTDRFSNVIAAVTDEDLRLMPVSPIDSNGKPHTARELQSAVPVAVRGGYRFALGDPGSDDPKWIRGANGEPFVLDIEKMEPVLRKRVPQAYTGN